MLAAPFKGQSILAIDPGYTAGCKIALVSETGVLLSYDTVYPHQGMNQRFSASKILRDTLKEHK